MSYDCGSCQTLTVSVVSYPHQDYQPAAWLDDNVELAEFYNDVIVEILVSFRYILWSAVLVLPTCFSIAVIALPSDFNGSWSKHTLLPAAVPPPLH